MRDSARPTCRSTWPRSIAERCSATIDRLGAYTRGGLSRRETVQVQTHLAECDRCPDLAAELSEINSGLRGLLAPLLLGSAAAGYLATLPAVPVLTQVGASVTGAGAGGSLLKFGALAKAGGVLLTPGIVTGGVLAAAVATVAAVVVGVATPGGPPRATDPIAAPVGVGNAGVPAAGTGANSADPFAGMPGVTVTPTTTDVSGAPVAATEDAVGPAATPSTAESTTPPAPTGAPSPAVTPAPTVPRYVPPTVDPGLLAGAQPLPRPGSFPPAGTPAATGTTPAPTVPAVPAVPTVPTVPSVPTVPTGGGTPGGTPVTPPPGVPTPIPTPAAVDVTVTTGITSFVAGRTQTVTLTVRNSGGTTQPAGTATLTAGPGISLVGGGVTVPALRSGSVAFARAADTPGLVICDGSTCPLPELAPGASVELTFQVQVAPTATATDISLTVYETPAISMENVAVGSGFASLQVVPSGPVAAGTNTPFVLTATPAEGVTDPGPVLVPAALTRDLYVSGTPEGCTPSPTGSGWECAPNADGQVGPLTIDTVAVPSATGAQQVAVSDAGGRALRPEAEITVIPLDASASVRMTGPFGGISIAAPTIYCDLPARGAIGECGRDDSPLVPTDPANVENLNTGGHTVVWAELTWASAGSTGDDTVTLNVNGAATSVTGQPIPVATSDKDRMTAHQADVTALITGDSSISVSDFDAALRVVENTTPFAVWSLSVIWADPGMADTTVTFLNSDTRMLPTRKHPVRAVLGTRDTPLSSLFVTLWATDPWGSKTLSLGEKALTTAINGVVTRDGARYTVGYDLLAFGPEQLGTATGALTLDNVVDATRRGDGIWVGPILALGPATTPTG